MVTTIRPRDYILGSLKIKAEDVGAPEWLAILKKAQRNCDPYLKYLPGFKPIKEVMNDRERNRKTDNAVVEFFCDFNEETLCVWVSCLSHETEGEIPQALGPRFFTEKVLLLTRKGLLVLWDAKYERELEWGPDRWGPGNSYDVIQTAIFSRFSMASDSCLLKLLPHHPRLGIAIVEKLWELTRKGIAERQKRLGDFIKMESELAGLLERVE